MEEGDAVPEGHDGELAGMGHDLPPAVEQVHPDLVAMAELEENLVVRLRGGDGEDFEVEARRLAALAPGFVFPFPAIHSLRVYRLVQEYALTRSAFTDPDSGEPLPGLEEALHDIIDDFDVEVEDDGIDTLGHLAKAAISLGMVHLQGLCIQRLNQLSDDREDLAPQIMMVLEEINGIPNPIP